MAEAIGLAAGIAGLASLAIQIGQVSFDYFSKLRRGSTVINQYLQELTALTSVLLQYQAALETPDEFKNHAAQLPPTLSLQVETCTKQMEALKARLNDRGYRSVLNHVKWPLEEKETLAVVDMLHRFRGIFDSAVSIATLSITTATLQEVRGAKADQDRRSLLDWLSPVSMGKRQNDLFRTRLPGTGQWILNCQQYEEWGRNTNHAEDFVMLWCYGKPGAGKSLITSFVVDWLDGRYVRSDTSTRYKAAVVYYYCDYQSTQQVQNAIVILQTLLRQLLEQTSGIPSEIQELYNAGRDGSETMTIQQVVDLFCLASNYFSAVYVVVDALDELLDFTKLISAFRMLESLGKYPTKPIFRILISSRPLTTIRDLMKGSDELEIVAVEPDVHRYIGWRIKQNEDLDQLVSSNLGKTIETEITRKASGIFLLVRLLMDTFTGLTTTKQVRQALQQMPVDLTQAYHSTLTRILHQSPAKAHLAKQALTWVVHAKTPLTIEELRHALAVEIGLHELDDENLCTAKLLVSVCLGLIYLDEEDKCVHLAHLTAKEYLLQAWAEENREMQTMMAKTCLTYISFAAFRESTCTDHMMLRKRFDDYPFYRYAACYWFDHMSGDVGLELTSQLRDFVVDEAACKSATQAFWYHQWTSKQVSNYAFDAIPQDFGTLHFAAFWGLKEIMMALLIEGRTGLSARDSLGCTPLHYASAQDHIDIVELLLTNGADLEAKTTLRGWTAIFSAAHRSRNTVVSYLIQQGADITTPDLVGRTLLHLATSSGNIDLAKELLSHGANIYAKDKDAKTPMMVAEKISNNALLTLFMEQSDQPVSTIHRKQEGGEKKKLDLLAKAAKAGAQSNFKHILEKESAQFENDEEFMQQDVLIRVRVPWGSTWRHTSYDNNRSYIISHRRGYIEPNYGVREMIYPNIMFQNALVEGNLPMIKSLIDYGVDLKQVYNYGQTALHVATFGDDPTTINFLLEMGINASSIDEDGQTALHFAVALGHANSVDVLINHKDLVNAVDEQGSSLLHVLWGWAEEREELPNPDIDDRVRILERLSAQGATINLQDMNGDTTLHNACAVGGFLAVQKLLLLGADPAITNKEGNNVVHVLAMSRGNEDSTSSELHAIMQYNAVDLNFRNNDGETPLVIAVTSSKWNLAHVMVDYGAMILEPKILRLPLFTAVWDGNQAAIKLLYELGAEKNSKDEYGEPLLLYRLRKITRHSHQRMSHHVAVKVSGSVRQEDVLSCTEVMLLLLNYGENVDSTDVTGVTPILEALQHHEWEGIVKLLLQYNADITLRSSTGFGTMHAAVLSGQESMVLLLFSLDIDVNLSMSTGVTPMMLAAANGFMSIVLLFLNSPPFRESDLSGTDWIATTSLYQATTTNDYSLFEEVRRKKLLHDTRDKEDQTPLHKACQHGNLAMVLGLLEMRVDASIQDSRGWQPIHESAAQGNLDVLKALTAYGVAIDTVTRSDAGGGNRGFGEPFPLTVLHLAASRGHTEMVEYILNATMEHSMIGIPSRHGRTPLMMAVEQDHVDIVRLLIARGVDVNAVGGFGGSSGFTAMDLARGHQEITRILAIEGARGFQW